MRQALVLALIGVVAFGVVGCKSSQSAPPPTVAIDDKTTTSEPPVVIRDVTPPPKPDEVVVKPSGPQTYTVQKGDTLFALARRFYNDQAKWKVIYEANRTSIKDKNAIKIGQTLTIPAN